ncbi:hypothetical protein JCM19376_34480 [Fusibacter bizertensis]
MSALNYDPNEKAKQILFSFIPFLGIYDGMKLLGEANNELIIYGYKFSFRGYVKLKV